MVKAITIRNRPTTTARASSSYFERSCNSKLFQSWWSWSCQFRRLRCCADLAARGAAPFALMKFNQWRQRLNFTVPSCTSGWSSGVFDHPNVLKNGRARGRGTILVAIESTRTSETGAHRVWDGTILVANESTQCRRPFVHCARGLHALPCENVVLVMKRSIQTTLTEAFVDHGR